MDQGWAYSSTFSKGSPDKKRTCRTPVGKNNAPTQFRQKAGFERCPKSEPFWGLLEEISESKSELILVTFSWHFCDIFVTFCDILTTFDDLLDCLIAFLLACLPACLLACFSACLLARSLACFLACFPACLLACFLEGDGETNLYPNYRLPIAHAGGTYW